MYWSWKQFLLLVYFELKCSLFGFFKMLRMKIRITGLQLQTARTEINNKQKKRKYFLFSAKRPVFETKQNRGNYVAENSFFLQHSFNPWRVFFLAFSKKQTSKTCGKIRYVWWFFHSWIDIIKSRHRDLCKFEIVK